MATFFASLASNIYKEREREREWKGGTERQREKGEEVRERWRRRARERQKQRRGRQRAKKPIKERDKTLFAISCLKLWREPVSKSIKVRMINQLIATKPHQRVHRQATLEIDLERNHLHGGGGAIRRFPTDLQERESVGRKLGITDREWFLWQRGKVLIPGKQTYRGDTGYNWSQTTTSCSITINFQLSHPSVKHYIGSCTINLYSYIHTHS